MSRVVPSGSSATPSATPRKEERQVLRILAVGAEGGGSGGLLHGIRQWVGEGGVEIEAAPDLPRAVRQLGTGRWHVVVAVLGEHADDDLAWWVDTLRGATAAPRLIAVAHGPSMGLVLRAEKLGVLDVLPLPVREHVEHSQFFGPQRSEEHTSELQSPYDLVCRLLLEKKKKKKK